MNQIPGDNAPVRPIWERKSGEKENPDVSQEGAASTKTGVSRERKPQKEILFAVFSLHVARKVKSGEGSSSRPRQQR
jgi:hypothetical protein